jgi:hypothetical protein
MRARRACVRRSGRHDQIEDYRPHFLFEHRSSPKQRRLTLHLMGD